jgi:molybdopterin-dependent oxidoreductase-like protein protein
MRRIVLGSILGLMALLANAPASAGGIALSGAIQHPAQLTMAQLRAMPAVDVKVDQKTEKGPFTGDFHGVLLWTLINNAGLVNGPARHAILLHGIVVSAAGDNYGTLISLGEIHPELGNAQVILATEENGKPLAQPILIVPGDIKAARDVRNVTSVFVQLGSSGHISRMAPDHLH